MNDEHHPEHDEQAASRPRSRSGASAASTEDSRPRSRSSRSSRPSSGDRDEAGNHAAARALRALFAATVAGSVLAIGSVHLPVLLGVAATAIASAALAFYIQADSRKRLPLSLPVITLLALSAYSFLQAAPLPMRALAAIAPLNADIWSRALLPLGEPGPTWASISLDPSASVIEGLKWLIYAAVFAAASALGSRRGAAWGVAVVFASAVLAALTTIGHGLLGVRKVYGLYEPSFSVSPWHVGPLLNPNNLAGYLNLGAMCGIGLMLMRRPAVPPWLAGLGVATTIAIELTSGSRAGVVALLLGVLAMAVLPRERSRHDTSAGWLGEKRFLLLIGAAVSGGAALAAIGGTGEAFTELYDQNIQKVAMLRWVTPMVRDYAWLGVGRGAFESAFPSYKVTPGNVVYTHAENFLMQWGSEWGVPVAAAAVIAFAIALAPGRMGVRRSAVAAGAWTGVVVLALQNMVDLGLEIPAVCIAACAATGSIWGDSRRRHLPREGAGDSDERPPEALRLLGLGRGSIAAGGVAVVGLFAVGLAVARGRHDLGGDRGDLREAYAAADLRRPEARAALRGDLRAAILRRPAEPYFPLLGALTAFRAGDQDPLPWLQRTLERDPINGRAHLLLAEVLNERGAKAQALLELRLAAENDATLIAPAAQTALRFTRRFEDLLRAVPSGEAGAATLDELGVRLATMGDEAARALCDREAIARDPGRAGPRTREALALIRALDPASGSSVCADRAACERAIEGHAEALAAAAPRSSLAAQIRARKLMAEGRAEEAERSLASECGRASDRAACARLRVEAAAPLKSTERMTAAVRDYLSTECARREACAEAAMWAGNMRAMRGEWGLAMSLYARAAREDPGEARWLALAEAASRSGAHAQAAEALEKVAQKRGGADAELRRRIDEERARAAGALVNP